MPTSSNKKKKYKFQHLKFYCNTQGLFETKMFRKVFVNSEVSYLYAEFACYNILFDEQDWSGNVLLKGYSLNGTVETEIFSLQEQLTIKKEENIFYYRQGWGNDKKTFWKEGTYVWKAFIDNELVATEKVIFEGKGLVTATENPYFDLLGVRFYTLLDDGFTKKYLAQFAEVGTAHIYAELSFKNKLTKAWQCEIEYMYFNEHLQKIAYFTALKTISSTTESISYGWGSSSKNWWKKGTYTCKILFMGQLIAVSSFEVGDVDIVGESPIIKDGTYEAKPQVTPEPIVEKSLEELLADFNQLTGLQNIKNQLNEYITFLNFEKLRTEKGLQGATKISLHTVLTGNPGTGKTTVAKKIGAIYKAMNLLSKGHVHEVDRADLVGEFIGQTAPRVKEQIEKARGGILFIDEAYSLHRPESGNDFGREVIEILLKEMSDGEGDLAVFVAGYPKEMKGFINSNPGLKSRFNTYFDFHDYLPEELMTIANSAFVSKGLSIVPEATMFMSEKVTRAYRDRDSSFGNARYILSLVDSAKMNMALRLAKHSDPGSLSTEELSTITLEDIQALFITGNARKLTLVIDEPRLKDAMNELESLIGMNNIKQEMRDLVKLVRYYNEIGKDVLNTFVLHTVFTGNPGTGKTTVARILAKIYNALGILEKGHLVECDRSDLVGEFLGQTGPKTMAKIEAAIGGVLFIDEAYSLAERADDMYGKEAISTLLKQMEDRNKEFVLIVAGYPNNMDVFLNSNPGLKSRFDQTMNFLDYADDELLEIAVMMFKKEDLLLDEEARQLLKYHFETLYANRDLHFGNAREARKIVQEIVQFHHLRMASLDSKDRTIQMITTISKDDLVGLKPIEKKDNRSEIGFRRG
jgi:SpoVK/Ycf46/Vps4 family AAA+-type ATPase